MRKFLLFFSVCLFIYSNGFAQWSTVNVGTTQDLYSVNHYNNSDIWIGSFNQIVKSANGGTSWSIVNPIKDPSNIQILPANMNDLALTGSNSAIGTGLFFTGNNECILTTANGGTNWTIATNNSTAPLLRYINTVDINGANVVAVGNTGRMFTSSNSGASFTFITSGTTKRLNDVKFASADTVFSVGEGVIMKSVNRGANWTANNTYTASLNQVSCVKSTIYIGTTYNNQILKSVDYGNTYSVINLPFVSTGVIYAVSKDTILAAGNTGLYVSKNGGQYWEKYNLTGYQQVKMFDRLPSNQLYAVGNTGYVIKAGSIAAAPSLAITSFSIQGGSTSFCLGDSVTLNNYTAPVAGYTYQWKIDGASFSSQYNSGKKLTAAGNHTLALDVTNSFGTSSYSVQIYVTGHDLNAFSMVSSNDTLCVGGLAGFMVPNTQSGANYQLRKGFTNIGAVKPGDGSTQEFIAYATYSNTTYNVKATRNNGCFVDSLIQSKTIIVNTNPKATAGSYTPSDNYCGSNPGYIPGITNVTFNTLNNNTSYVTNNYFDYSCCRGTTVTMGNAYTFSITTAYVWGEYVKVWIDYNNNGTFEIPSEVAFSDFANHTTGGMITIGNTMFFNQKLRMRVASDISSGTMNNANSDFYCGQIEDYYLTIVPAPVLPTASFNYSITPGCLSTVTFTNTSYNASSYTWGFGDGSAVATTSNTSHVYGISGTYITSLNVCNPTGCNTFTQSILISIPQVPIPAYCTPINEAGNQHTGGMTEFRIDTTGDVNQYFWDAPTNAYDATCFNTLYLRESKLYNMHIRGTQFHPLGDLSLSIDFDNNGVFDNIDYVWEAGTSGCCPSYPTGVLQFGPFRTIIPPTAIRNTPLRMRVIVYDASYYNGYFQGDCTLNGGIAGVYHDYTVIIKDPLPVIPDFTESRDTVCSSSNQFIQFYNKTQNGSKFYWDFGDGTTSTEFEPNHLYSTPGIYSVKLKATSSMYADSVIKTNLITVLPGLPTPSITVNGSVLTTTSTAPGYQWYRNYVAIPGAATSSYTATQDGDYVVKLINSNGCNAPSDVFEYYPVHLTLDFSTDTICVGDYVFANHTRDNATTLWLKWGEGVNDLLNWNGLGGPYHIYGAPGTYTVSYKGCGSYNCDSLTKTIVVVPGQDTALIVLNNGVLSTTTSAVGYQWYVDNNAIPGATSQSYTPVQDGYYQIKLTNSGGCNSLSNYFIHFPIHFSFIADTIGYCGVTSAEVQFYNSTTNAISYLWDFGDGDTSSVVHPSHLYNAPGIYNVKLKATSANAVDSLIKNSYITVTSTPFIPTITASSTVQVCYGDTIELSCTNAPNGRYQWYDGPSTLWWDTLSTYKAVYASNFYMLATNSIGCSAFSNTIIPGIDNECVWPGDADLTYSVDNYDLLPIGLFYGETGAARSYTSNAWAQNPAVSWGTGPSGWSWLDKKYSDCNGDGIINDDDTLAITLNFNLNHAKSAPSNLPQSTLTDPQLYFTTPNTTYSAGQWVDIYINLGDVSTPCIDMYGLLYDVVYDSYLVEPGTMSITYPNSWINAGSTPSLSLTKVDQVNGEIYTAITKTDHQNASGYGVIAKMRFQVSTMLTTDDYLSFYFDDREIIDNMGNYISVYPGPVLGLDVTVLPTNVNELSNSTGFQISPNPHSDKADIKFNLKASSNVTLSLMNTLGEVIYTLVDGSLDVGKHKFTLNTNELKLASGIYYIKMNVDGKISSHKIIKLD